MSRGRLEQLHSRRKNDDGFVTIEFIVAVAFSFLLLVMVTNLVIVQYGRGIVRASVDEAARAGARISTDPIASCNQRAQSVMDGIGNLASNVELNCEAANGQIRATATADFEGWLPFVPNFTEDAVATASQAQAPA